MNQRPDIAGLCPDEIRAKVPGHPRSCGGVSGPVYTLDQCRLCWRVTYDPTWSGHARLSDQPSPFAADPLDCRHRGLAAIGGAHCGCAAGTTTPVYSCSVRGMCSTRPVSAVVKLTTGGETREPVADCSKCGERLPSEKLDNPPVPTIADYPGPQIKPVRRVRLSEELWPTADRHFQASIIEHDGRLWCATRMRWSNAKIVLSELGKDYQPIRARRVTMPSLGHNWTGDEDPRLFAWRGQLWLCWTAWDGRSTPSKSNSTTPILSRVRDDLTVDETHVVAFGARRGWEKNWGFFRWDDGRSDRLFAVYQPAPLHRVIEVVNWHARHATDSSVSLPDGLGLIRGGAPPVRRGNELWSVGHAVYRDDKGRQWYAATLYTLDDRPPFSPRRWLPVPLLDPRIEPRAAGVSCNERVVFPCGAFFRDDRLVVSCGWHDRWAESWEFDAGEIERRLVAIPGADKVEPPLPMQVVEYGAAAARWVAAGMPTRTDQQVERILATCQSGQCGKWRGDHCAECGCPVNRGPALENKARMETEKCPLGFWV